MVVGLYPARSYTPAITDLYDRDPHVRLEAARSIGRFARKSVLRSLRDWPLFSPGAANAWLLLVTTKPPSWRDPLVLWPDGPPTLGTPHEGFFYPDPLGFWREVRRWSTEILSATGRPWAGSDALSVTAMLHANQDAARVSWARERCKPVVTVFLDEAARQTAGDIPSAQLVTIPDPHRPETVYEGWWTKTEAGVIVGKSPQHPASHLLYRQSDMDTYLHAVPL